MVKQHKLVTETLKKEIEGIHGLQVRFFHLVSKSNTLNKFVLDQNYRPIKYKSAALQIEKQKKKY